MEYFVRKLEVGTVDILHEWPGYIPRRLRLALVVASDPSNAVLRSPKPALFPWLMESQYLANSGKQSWRLTLLLTQLWHDMHPPTGMRANRVLGFHSRRTLQ